MIIFIPIGYLSNKGRYEHNSFRSRFSGRHYVTSLVGYNILSLETTSNWLHQWQTDTSPLPNTSQCLSISKEWGIRDHLNITKVSAKWVPKLLQPDQLQLQFFMLIWRVFFLQSVVALNETRVHHFQPETKTTIKTMEASRVIGSKERNVSFNGVLMVDDLAKYRNILCLSIKKEIKIKHYGKLPWKVMFHQEYFSSFTSLLYWNSWVNLWIR